MNNNEQMKHGIVDALERNIFRFAKLLTSKELMLLSLAWRTKRGGAGYFEELWRDIASEKFQSYSRCYDSLKIMSCDSLSTIKERKLESLEIWEQLVYFIEKVI